MPYSFKCTQNATAIEEQKYAIGQEVRFTKFTSCLGVIAQQGSSLIGVHLVIVSDEGEVFNDTVTDVLADLLKSYEVKTVIGKTDFWQGSISDAYSYLLRRLGNPPRVSVDDGVYGGKLNEGKLQLYKNGSYI
jgi:hypothetical protein